MRYLGFGIYIVFVICFYIPSIAYAYLDPGTGNALVYMIISLFGAAIFFVKGLFYKLVGKKSSSENWDHADKGTSLVLVSEGKMYSNTFMPIIQELLNRGAYFTYYTMDVNDPALIIDDPHINNRYIGNGNMAFSKIGNLEADIVLMTTPNIGTEGYPVPRSPKIKNLVHITHGFDIGCYKKYSLDNYDTVFLVGKFTLETLRQIEKVRHLPAKKVYPTGLPTMDVLAARKAKDEAKEALSIPLEKTVYEQKGTILVAPSWGDKGCLKYYGYHFIELLAQAGFYVILRPHPQSRKVEQKLLAEGEQLLQKYPNVHWDNEVIATSSMEAADVMISDMSTVRADFMFIYQKPVITLMMPPNCMDGFEMAELGKGQQEDVITSISHRISMDEIDQIVPIVEKVIAEKTSGEMAEKIIAFRDENIYHWGHSAEVIADYLVKAMAGQDEATLEDAGLETGNRF